MIEAVTIERFRGLRRLEVEDFGRVNLIIGKNDCGKTALMEALVIAEDGVGVANKAFFVQRLRRSPLGAGDFDRFWRPLFWNQETAAGFSIEVCGSRPEPLRIEFHKSASPPTMLTEQTANVDASATWALDVRIVGGDERTEQIVGGAAGLRLPPAPARGAGWWVRPQKTLGDEEIVLFSRLKQAGREAELLEVLRDVNDRVSAIEILVLKGTEAELFVRLEPGAPLLPIAMMGDGFQRCFEMALCALTRESWPLFVDELDNGLHHSILDPVWRWLAVISKKRGFQIFATTHSEECIHAASRAFTALNDDGLRVIRLDRHDGETTAAIYSRELVETAADAGVEIRG